MPKNPVSMKIDSDLLKQVDEAAAWLGMNRSAFIERSLIRTVDNLDAVVEEMSADSPLTAAVLDALASNQKLAMAITKVVAREMSPEQFKSGLDQYPKLRAEAKRRKTAKKKRK